jgi:hypothetical protein
MMLLGVATKHEVKISEAKLSVYARGWGSFSARDGFVVLRQSDLSWRLCSVVDFSRACLRFSHVVLRRGFG